MFMTRVRSLVPLYNDDLMLGLRSIDHPINSFTLCDQELVAVRPSDKLQSHRLRHPYLGIVSFSRSAKQMDEENADWHISQFGLSF